MRGEAEMSNYQIGDIIRRTRKYLKMSQEKLSDNICSVQTLSRIENNKGHVKSEIYERLMERMGRNPNRSYCMLDIKDNQILERMEQINFKIDQNECEKIQKELKRIEQVIQDQNMIWSWQYMQRRKILIRYKLGKIKKEEAKEQLEKLIESTIEDPKRALQEHYPFTEEEIQIYINIAAIENELGQKNRAIVIYQDLLECIDQEYMTFPYRTALRELILFNLAKIYRQEGSYEQSMDLCKKNLQALHKKENTVLMINVYLLYAWNMIEMKDMNKDTQEICKDYIKKAYALAVLSQNQKMVKEIEIYYKSVFREEIYSIS